MPTTKNLTIRSSVGLHARPAAEFVKIAQEFDGEVIISYNDQEVDGKSMIGILKLSHNTVKSTAFRQASAERAPPPTIGLFAMMPITFPCNRASPTTKDFPNLDLISKKLFVSTITVMIFLIL